MNDDELQTGQALPLQKTASGQNPRQSHQHAHLHAHVWLEEEKRKLGHPQTNPRKSDSVSPDDEKSVQEKETSSWYASWLVCRSSH